MKERTIELLNDERYIFMIKTIREENRLAMIQATTDEELKKERAIGEVLERIDQHFHDIILLSGDINAEIPEEKQ